MGMKHASLGIVALSMMAALAGCSKNVERMEFEKWGNSYVPRGSSIDTSAQGGVSTAQGNAAPQNGIHAVPKASVGGTYQRSFATSTNYKMVGGFHVGPSQ
jgi:hypothetical protein